MVNIMFYKMISCVLFLYIMQKTAAEKIYFSRRIRTNENGNMTAYVFENVLEKGIYQCIQTCKAKKRCKFINYLVKEHTCSLIGIDGGDVIFGKSIEKKSRYIFGDKSEWNMVTHDLFKDEVLTGSTLNCTYNFSSDVKDKKLNFTRNKYAPCEECNDHGVCKMNQDRSYNMCENSGCQLPKEKERTTILGNMFSVGNRIAYKCNVSYEVNNTGTVSSTCSENGEWSGRNINCISAASTEEEQQKGSTFYSVVNTKFTWDKAKKNCEKLGGYLSDIKTEQEQTRVQRLVSYMRIKRNVWIGGRNTQDDEDTYIWLDNTSVSSGYVNWLPGKPYRSGGGIRCIRMSNNRDLLWNDVNCSQLSASVCEFRLH